MKKLITIALTCLATGIFAQTATRIDINGDRSNPKVEFKDIKVKDGKGTIETYSWDKENGKYSLYTSLVLTPDKWEELGIGFTPLTDGNVTIQLMGRHQQAADGKGLVPVITYFDKMMIKGAKIKNGDFEELDDIGRLKDWLLNSAPMDPATDAKIIKDRKFVKSGKQSVRTWHNQRFIQTIKVKADVPVMIKVWAYCPSK